jgi:hypothetical protein
MTAQRGEYKYSCSHTVDSAVEAGGCSTPRPEFYAREHAPVSIVQVAVWVSDSVWMGAKNLLTRFRNPNPSAHRESLYRIRYLACL